MNTQTISQDTYFVNRDKLLDRRDSLNPYNVRDAIEIDAINRHLTDLLNQYSHRWD